MDEDARLPLTIIKIEIEDRHVLRRLPIIEKERALAIKDLQQSTSFYIQGDAQPPYYIRIGLRNHKLIFKIRNAVREELEPYTLTIKPFKRIIKDYFMMCESFADAYRSGQQAKVETLDMTRRALHNEGAERLKGYLEPGMRMDILTARGFFTLLCVLHI